MSRHRFTGCSAGPSRQTRTVGWSKSETFHMKTTRFLFHSLRRRWMFAILGGTLALRSVTAAAADDAWKQADEILARISAPTFPKRDYVITKFGATAGGEKDARPAIVAAM